MKHTDGLFPKLHLEVKHALTMSSLGIKFANFEFVTRSIKTGKFLDHGILRFEQQRLCSQVHKHLKLSPRIGRVMTNWGERDEKTKSITPSRSPWY